jgi:hypothetical protein
MADLCSVLQMVSLAAWGLFAGAQLAEGCLLVPYWRSLAPADFLDWYAANDRRLVAFFGPLTIAITLASLAFMVAAIAAWHPARWSAVLSAVVAGVVVAAFFAYFKDANARFAAKRISDEALPAELSRWALLHWVRTVLALVVFAALLAWS